MSMFKSCSIFVLTLILVSTVAWAMPVPPAGYQIETYASYSSVGMGKVFDLTVAPDGQIYLTHRGTSDYGYNNGSMTRISSEGVADPRWIDDLGSPRTVAWAGGTPYGENLYFVNLLERTISKINSDGSYSNLRQDSNTWPATLAFDRNGSYGESMYYSTKGAGAGGQIYSVSINGSRTEFSPFPNVQLGGIVDLKISPTSRYDGSMFAALDEDHSKIVDGDGIYKIDPDGIASAFAPGISSVRSIEFDIPGLLFDNDLIAIGTSSDPDVEGMHLWRIDESGNAEDFMRVGWDAVNHMSFGPDGAMYLSRYMGDTTEILRVSVVPEPASLLLLGLGGFLIRKRKVS